MGMTKSDYTLISSTLAALAQAKRSHPIKDVAEALAERMQQCYPHFNRMQFLRDCGVAHMPAHRSEVPHAPNT